MSNDPFNDPLGNAIQGVLKTGGKMASNLVNKGTITRQMGAKYAKGQKDKVANEIVGSCIVNIHSPRINRVRIETPENLTTDSGSSYSQQIMNFFNKGRLFTEYVGQIVIYDFLEPIEIKDAKDLVTFKVKFAEPKLRNEGYQAVKTFEGSIANRNGAITIGQYAATSPDIVMFQFTIDELTQADGFLLLPFNKAASEILDSIQVELKEKRSYDSIRLKEDGNPSEQSPAPSDSVHKLKQLKELLDDGLITKSEYESKRQEIISRI